MNGTLRGFVKALGVMFREGDRPAYCILPSPQKPPNMPPDMVSWVAQITFLPG